MSVKFPVKPNKRTIGNLDDTAKALSVFRDTKALAEALGVQYPAAADRLKVLKDSGRYIVEEQQGERTGKRGARPTLYRVTLRPEFAAPVAPAPATPDAG
jgi:hypothetical protein